MGKLTLLVADDVEMNRVVIRKFLKGDYNVLEAADGETAVDMIKSNHVDFVLLDVIMPKMNGLQVLEWIKNNPEYSHIGVLVATSTKEKTEREALSTGADDIVGKPYDPVIIKARLKNIAAKKQLEKTISGDENQLKNMNSTINRKEAEEKIRLISTTSELLIKNIGNKKLVEEFAKKIAENADWLSEQIQAGKEMDI